jgi:hypothetical protein
VADHEPLDARLGDLPLPAGLQQRMSLEALFDDAAIDRLLRGVPVPDGLGERVLAGRGQSRRSSRSVDLERLGRAEGPAPTTAAAGGRTRDRTWLVAVNAGLLASALAVLILAGTVPSVVPRRPIDIAMAPADPGSLPERGGRIEWLPGDAGSETAVSRVEDSPLDPLHVSAMEERGTDPPEVVSNAFPVPREDLDDGLVFTPEVVGSPVVGPAFGRGVVRMDVVPQSGAGPRRMVPRAPGYDMVFELKHGEPPFVYPAAGPAVDAPPLSWRTASFDAIRWSPQRRVRRSEAARLRVEDVLAAVPERFESRSDGEQGPRLTMHGVRSLRPMAAALVEIEITAPRLTGRATAVDAAIVLDRSAAPAAWAATCRGLRMVAAEMRSADRLTIVVGGERSRLAGRQLDAAALAAAVAELERERPATADGIVAAVQFARHLLATGGGSGPVVLVTDAAADAEQVKAAEVGDAVVVRLASHPGQAAGTDAADVEPTAAAVGRAIVERVFGRSALTATGCRLSVAFDPRFVHAYRLVGYRQTAVESLASGGADPIDLVAGQTVRVVYEVVGRPAAPSRGAVAEATLHWHPAAETGNRSLTVSLDRTAIETAGDGDAAPPGQQTWLPSPRGCELLLAVGLGEFAAESVHLGPRVGGPALADLVKAWRRRGNVTTWGDVLIDALERLGVVKPTRPEKESGS